MIIEDRNPVDRIQKDNSVTAEREYNVEKSQGNK